MSDAPKTDERLAKFALSKQQGEAIAKWLSTKWPDKLCPHCKATEWAIGLFLTSARAVPPERPGDLIIGATPIYPFVPIGCENCGYTAFVNVLTIGGIVPQEGATDATK